MRYITDRKRANPKGAAHTGTEHHWFMMVSSVALAFLIPAFVIAFGRALGGSHEEVLAFFARPFIAILTGLTLVASMRHFAKGATTMIEDYAQGTTRKALIIGAISLSWAVTATGLFALAKIAL
ncbi:succinate dehydrogenase, hydrophobic membrane anchor protein [Frigidibacter albus]|uniref:Succinate dehydrogenase hydrophobic membrane anchor subunit n=1 Tax=Frigidibacter albus TaxID=1465486 RepID=A0A6L8VMZ1_9RHOB|nr:succinate dehydrogenase, hydrophobic membrane anchor protein [Frigidibacter albus]MZQ90892.1 succinate dehydrogenase, hydrophobic membrane anchor protein [Frigidibacter albus]NBE32490.1 succinate dehydrogenase, hydrophobic membrane anchor protein [Frigidibacter albus]GGH61693.1 succinate dehydrogenase [Frigidibacter albus]